MNRNLQITHFNNNLQDNLRHKKYPIKTMSFGSWDKSEGQYMLSKEIGKANTCNLVE